jgi:hypothetical protein
MAQLAKISKPCGSASCLDRGHRVAAAAVVGLRVDEPPVGGRQFGRRHPAAISWAGSAAATGRAEAMSDTRHDSDAASDGLDPPWQGGALRALAGQLPSVAEALEAFIARANETELAVAAWDAAPARTETQIEDDAAAEARARVAETELRDAEARAQALRRELDELQAKLAAAEARAAASAVEARTTPGVDARGSVPGGAERASADRASPASASVAVAAPRPWPWAAVVGSFVGGIVVMFVVSRLVFDEPAPVPAAEATSATPGSAPGVAEPRPTVTPIEPGGARPVVTPIEPALDPELDPDPEPAAPGSAAPPSASPASEDPAASVPAERGPAGAQPAPRRPRPTAAPTAPDKTNTAAKQAPPAALADPFGAPPARPPRRPPPPATPPSPATPPRPAGQLVDPF